MDCHPAEKVFVGTRGWYGGQSNDHPQDVRILVPGTYKVKRDSADVSK